MSNINKLNKGVWWLYTQICLRPKFHSIGKGAIVFSPLQLDNTSSISIGTGVFISEGGWLMGKKNCNGCTLSIGEKTVIGHMAHIVGLSGVNIGKSVLMADKVFISDCTHEYEDITRPIGEQTVKTIKKISIGDEAWIGENVCVLGASVGKHSVIGSNSVVTKDIPDYSVASGIPARVIKQYDFDQKCWVKVKRGENE